MFCLKVWVIFIFPVDCGLQEAWRFHYIPRSWENSWVTLAIKELHLLSLQIGEANLNLEIISFSKAFLTSEVFSDLQGNASTHPLRASAKTICKEHLDPSDFWVRSCFRIISGTDNAFLSYLLSSSLHMWPSNNFCIHWRVASRP